MDTNDWLEKYVRNSRLLTFSVQHKNTTTKWQLSILSFSTLVLSADYMVDANWGSMFPVSIYWDGTCLWNIESYFQSSCSLKFSQFPFDKQSCDLIFGSVFLTENLMNITSIMTEIDMTLYVPSSEFE